MSNYNEINTKEWARTELFEFYKTFDKPVFNIMAKVNAKKIYKYAKRHHESFFLMTCYAISKAVNEVPELRQRVIDGKPVECEKVDVCTPIMNSNDAFQEVILTYYDTYEEFKKAASPIIERAKNADKGYANENAEDRVLISCLPWLHFESYTCPDFDNHQVMPIITYGKMEKNMIPVNLKASHYFVDGLHVARFFNLVEKYFSNPKML